MTKEVLDKKELFSSIRVAIDQHIHLFSSLDECNINRVPFEGSWTAGQLLRHITKSTNALANTMVSAKKSAGRNPSQNVPNFKKTFLSTANKFEAPEFIVPENIDYKKENSIEELLQSFQKLEENAEHTDLDDLVEGLPFGPATKLEILHFVLYHTQRHLRQMQNICEVLKK